jgi:hypothetical protein
MNTTVIFWKPELLIRAQASGLYVAVKATSPSSPKPADPSALVRQYVNRR